MLDMTRYDKMVAAETDLNSALDKLEEALEGSDTSQKLEAYTNYTVLV
jgi:hypothetical protein